LLTQSSVTGIYGNPVLLRCIDVALEFAMDPVIADMSIVTVDTPIDASSSLASNVQFFSFVGVYDGTRLNMSLREALELLILAALDSSSVE